MRQYKYMKTKPHPHNLDKEKDPIVKKFYLEDNVNILKDTKLPKYTKAVHRFIKENDREPTAIDFDTVGYLPSSRTLQRLYGGLPRFRKEVGLKINNFTKGKERTKKAKVSMDDCLKDETELFLDLLKKYTRKNVSSPARIFQGRGFTADIRLDIDDTIYLIDIFKPNSTHSFKGCVHAKNRKYLLDEESFYIEGDVKFLYVCVNDEVMVPINNPIPVMSLLEFRNKFLSQITPQK